MKCPVCKKHTGFYYWPLTMEPDKMGIYEYPLYQRFYPGKPKYISPRCDSCFDQAVAK